MKTEHYLWLAGYATVVVVGLVFGYTRGYATACHSMAISYRYGKVDDELRQYLPQRFRD